MSAVAPLGKTLAVILGSQAWPNMGDALKPSDAFALSSGGFKEYLQDDAGLNLPNASIKDLFDSPLPKDAVDQEIANFLRAHYKDDSPDFDTLIIYYTGHADFTRGEQNFYLTLRSTAHWSVDYSGYQMRQLADTVNKFARVTRKIVILDCCYAAGAFVDWQRQGVGDVDTAVGLQAQNHFARPSQGPPPPRESGTVLLCACNEDKWALYQDGKATMFSDGLVQALRTGDRARGETLSVDDILQLTQQHITKANENSAVKPWLRVAKGSEDALKAAPLFPNPARRVDMVANRVQALEATVEALRAQLAAPVPTRGDDATAQEVAELRAELRKITEKLDKEVTAPPAVPLDQVGRDWLDVPNDVLARCPDHVRVDYLRAVRGRSYGAPVAAGGVMLAVIAFFTSPMFFPFVDVAVGARLMISLLLFIMTFTFKVSHSRFVTQLLRSMTPSAGATGSSETYSDEWRRYPILVDAIENPPATMFGLPVSRPHYVVASLAVWVALVVSGFSVLIGFRVLPEGPLSMFQ